MAKPQVILDCNVFVSSFISPKSISNKILSLAESGRIEIWVSDYLISELKDVLARPEFGEIFPHFSSESLKAFLFRIRSFARYMRNIQPRFVLSRDPKDSHYIDLLFAVEALFSYQRPDDRY